MADEDINNDSGQEKEEELEKPDRSANRFKDLSDKVKTTAEERDKIAKEIAINSTQDEVDLTAFVKSQKLLM